MMGIDFIPFVNEPPKPAVKEEKGKAKAREAEPRKPKPAAEGAAKAPEEPSTPPTAAKSNRGSNGFSCTLSHVESLKTCRPNIQNPACSFIRLPIFILGCGTAWLKKLLHRLQLRQEGILSWRKTYMSVAEIDKSFLHTSGGKYCNAPRCRRASYVLLRYPLSKVHSSGLRRNLISSSVLANISRTTGQTLGHCGRKFSPHKKSITKHGLPGVHQGRHSGIAHCYRWHLARSSFAAAWSREQGPSPGRQSERL